MNTSGTVSDAVLAVEVVDGEAADAERLARIEDVGQRARAGFERHREGEALEHRAQLVDAGGHAVEPVRLAGVDRVVGIEVGQRGQRQHFAGVRR